MGESGDPQGGLDDTVIADDEKSPPPQSPEEILKGEVDAKVRKWLATCGTMKYGSVAGDIRIMLNKISIICTNLKLTCRGCAGKGEVKADLVHPTAHKCKDCGGTGKGKPPIINANEKNYATVKKAW